MRFFVDISSIHHHFSRCLRIILKIEGHGEEGKVHTDLIFPKMSETFVVHIVLHLSENHFWPPILASLFRGQSLPCSFLVVVLPMVDFDDTDRIMLGNILINTLRGKAPSSWVAISKSAFCHKLRLVSKATKTLGHIKASACESRSFVNIRRGYFVLTHFRPDLIVGYGLHKTLIAY